jgi:hypothetical protein
MWCNVFRRMSDQSVTKEKDLPFISFDGRKCTLVEHADGWRYRCRAAGREADLYFPVSLTEAKKALRSRLEEGRTGKRPKKEQTLEDLAATYLALPKRASEESAQNHISRLRGICRSALGLELNKVPVSKLGLELWEAFQAKRQGGKLDLSTRRPENVAINAAIKSARKMFTKALLPRYKAAGYILPDDINAVTLLPEMDLPKPPAEDAKMIEAWMGLKDTNKPLWRAVGLARFAGLRRKEIQNSEKTWVIERKGGVYVELRDRAEDTGLVHTKTGKSYFALIISPELAADLLEAGDGYLVEIQGDRHTWFRSVPLDWLKPFTGKARKPLHRLRGLYADEVAAITEEAVRARAEGVKAAAVNLGHGKNTRTTEKHYLSADALH